MTRLRRTLIPSAILLSVLAQPAAAISVADWHPLSVLGDPLRLQLELYDMGAVRLSEIQISEARPADYSRLGLVPPAKPDNIHGSVWTENGRFYATLQGERLRLEPNVNLLLQITWPSGVRLQQVMTVLPTSALPPVASAPSQAGATTSAAPAAASAGDVSTASDAGASSSVAAAGVTAPAPSATPADATAAAPADAVAASANGSAATAAPASQVIPIQPPQAVQQPAQTHAPVEVAPSAAAKPFAKEDDGEVSLTLVNPSAAAKDGGTAAADSPEVTDLEATRQHLTAERDALRARQTALEKEAQAQDARLKVLDAQLAALNTPAPAAADKPPVAAQPADDDSQMTWLLLGLAVTLLLLILALRRRAAHAEQQATAAPSPVTSSDAPTVSAAPVEPTVPTVVAAEAPAVAEAEHPAVVAAAHPASGEDEPEYDFLTDSEAAAFQTRLDLATAYLDMKEQAAARDLLEKVVSGGTQEQRRQASALLASLT